MGSHTVKQSSTKVVAGAAVRRTNELAGLAGRIAARGAVFFCPLSVVIHFPAIYLISLTESQIGDRKCKVPERVEPRTPRFDHIHRHPTRPTTCPIRRRHRTARVQPFRMGILLSPFFSVLWTRSLDCK